MEKVNLAEKISHIDDYWSPRVIAEMDDYQFRIFKIQGEFVWHCHPNSDEVFIVVEGQVTIELRNGNVTLNKGELYVVGKGVEHRPVAEHECHMMLIRNRKE